MTLATVAIPTFNREESLRRAVASVLAQDYAPLELVICDNASTDGTESFCLGVAARDGRVRYVRHARNIGALANFESALAEAAGRYFMWLADDDWLDPNYLVECIRALEDGAHLAAGRARWFDASGQKSDECPMRLLGDDPADRIRRFYRTVSHNSVFYGVSRTSSVRHHVPLPRSTGGDWLFVASSAFAGRVETVETTSINRAGGGASDAITDHSSIPFTVVGHVLRSPDYADLGRFRRPVLALQCGAITGWRVWIRSPLLTWLRRHIGDAVYFRLRGFYRNVGRARSRSEIVRAGIAGQEMESDGSSHRIPAEASET